jgi:hypothetical protein
MEEARYAEDPRFASRIKKTKSRSAQRGRIVIGVVAGIAGLALVILSAMSSLIWLGAVGFAIMVAGIAYAVTPVKGRLQAVSDDGTARAAPKSRSRGAKQGTFMERLEERWDRRRRDQW